MNDNAVERVRAQDIDTATMPTLDVRSHAGGEQIRGALRYDAKALLSQEPLALPLPHEGTVVVYGDNDESALRVATHLIEQGYEKAAILDGGFDAYKALDLPVEPVTQEQPVPGKESSGIPRG
ncbi:MAG: rhodanese-like domain-containing protein [Candidatus Baltobacteraceae bacterium]